MPEKVVDIYAGSHSVFQVVKSEDGLTVTIRLTENHDHKIDLISSVVPTLIRVLQDITKP